MKQETGCITCKRSFYFNKKERDEYFENHPQSVVECPYCGAAYTKEELFNLKMRS